jgi:hypothetical protein
MRSTLLLIVTIGLTLSAAALANEPLVDMESPVPVDQSLGFALGTQYESTDIDLDLDGHEENFDLQALYGTLTVPLSTQWDFMLRLGGANASTTDFNGHTEWAWGMGLHAIIITWDELSLEATGQITSVTSSAARTVVEYDGDNEPNSYRGDDELSLFEYNLMTGPTWTHGPLTLSAGAMARYMTGEFTIYRSPKRDVDHDIRVGGYVGARFDVTEPVSLYGDVQLDEQLTRFSAGLLWRL